MARRRVHRATICTERERSHTAYLLLQGSVRILQDDRVVAVERREGTFLGEVSTLTGARRTAGMQADGTVYMCVLNAAELEQFVTGNPAVGIRIIRSMAERIVRETSGR